MISAKIEQKPHRRLLRARQVGERCGWSIATTWRRVNDDPTFPRPIHISAGITVFDETELNAWIESKKSSGSS